MVSLFPQTVTQPVWAVWAADQHAAENVLLATDLQGPNVWVITH